ncbi:MAG: hypothetical protein IJ844_03175, partial [Prevotella sp.]|nr:hypothetical protein [Prevotella sp.]
NYNTFGNDCNYNTFGNDCDSNTFGNYFYRNTFGNDCYSNTFGNDCYGNTFGNDCDSNTFGNDVRNSRFGSYIQHFTVFDGVNYVDVAGGESGEPRRNAQILNGTAGTDADHLLQIEFQTGLPCTQIAGLNSDGELSTWIPANLA